MSAGPAADRQPRFALDTSAVLAMLQNAPGGSLVGIQLHQAVVSTVNWSEVVEYSRAHKVDIDGLREDLEKIGMRILPFTIEDADQAADFWDASRRIRLSLADRACLALAARLKIPAMTADRSWQQLSVGVEIHLLR